MGATDDRARGLARPRARAGGGRARLRARPAGGRAPGHPLRRRGQPAGRPPGGPAARRRRAGRELRRARGRERAPPRALPAGGDDEPRGGRPAPAAARPLRPDAWRCAASRDPAERRGGRAPPARLRGRPRRASPAASTARRRRSRERIARGPRRCCRRVRLPDARAAPDHRRPAPRSRSTACARTSSPPRRPRRWPRSRAGTRWTTSDVRRGALLALAHRRRRGPLEQPGLDPSGARRALDGRRRAAAGRRRPDRRPAPPRARTARPASAAAPGPTAPEDRPPEDGPPTAAARARPARRAHGGTGAGAPRSGPRWTPRPAFRPGPAPGAGAARRAVAAAREAEAAAPVGDRRHAARGSWPPPPRCARPRRTSARARPRRAPGLALAPRRPARAGARGARGQPRAASWSTPAARWPPAGGCARSRARCSRCSSTPTSAATGWAWSPSAATGAELLLPPTASVELARAGGSAELPTGGRTPLAAGLERARDARCAPSACATRAGAPLVVLVTDGRANAGGRERADDAARRARARRRLGATASRRWSWTPRRARSGSGWPRQLAAAGRAGAALDELARRCAGSRRSLERRAA